MLNHVKRNRLLKLRKNNSSDLIKNKINDLNSEIKKDSVRKGILPGNSRLLWSALR